MQRGEENEAARNELLAAVSDITRDPGDSMVAAFDHFKSAGNVFDVDAETINATEESIKELTAKPLEEISPEVVKQQEEAHAEDERLMLALTSLLSVNEATSGRA